jgi:hypothetical protein
MKTICLKPWELAAYMRWRAGGHRGAFLLVRPVKPRRSEMVCSGDCSGPIMEQAWRDPGLGGGEYLKVPCGDGASQRVFCPFGSIGEVLGVKEPWLAPEWCDDLAPSLIKQDEAIWFRNHPNDDPRGIAEADGNTIRISFAGKWRPAQHMPPWAIRHRPTIADIRVMRVGEMSEEDAQATGMRSFTKDGRLHKFWFCDPVEDNPPKSLRVSWADMPRSAAEAFKELWNKHYPTHSWAWGIELREGENG